MVKVQVSCEAEHDIAQTRSLAQHLGLEWVEQEALAEADFLLYRTTERLELRFLGPRACGPVFVDFVHGKAAYRRQHGGGLKMPLAKAVGIQAKQTPKVLDATAGLGRDAFVLATLGCEVVMLERNPIVHALLEDGLQRAKRAPSTRAIAGRMHLLHADALTYLPTLDDSARPDVIYLDPMYPHKTKQALAKKDMQALQRLLGQDNQRTTLLRLARLHCKKRLVMKRPVWAESVDRPDFSYRSSKTLFDVYRPKPAA